MPIRGQKTKSDFIEWGKLQSCILKLHRDGDEKFSLLMAIGAFTGLRISDILSLTWENLTNKDTLEIIEKKTKKYRKIYLHPALTDRINACKKGQGYIFTNKKGGVFSEQYINNRMKFYCVKYQLGDPAKIKSHSLRKSFGRRFFEANGESEKALILLSDVFGHSNIKTTRIYLGLKEIEFSIGYFNL
jgi:integrase